MSGVGSTPVKRATYRSAGLAPDPAKRRLLVTLLVLILVFAFFIGGRLFSPSALFSMGIQLPEFAILSLAMTVTLLSGGVDLSIIAVADLAALTAAFTLHVLVPQLGPAGIAIALAAGLGVAAVVGVINGVLVAVFGVSPILATLGTMTAVKGIGVGLTHGGVISGFPDAVTFLGNGSILGIPVSLFVLAALAVPLGLMLTKSPFGTFIAITGTDEKVVRYSGISTGAVILKVYVLSALLSAIAGFIMMGRFNSANPSYGESYLLVTILAAVLGGVDANGGFGSIGGVLIALAILQLISTAFNLLGLNPFLTLAIWGATLILTAGIRVTRDRIDVLLHRKRMP
jgi:simple sugar transport system permease protein